MHGVSDRQELIPGWDQERFSSSTVLLAGAGGIGGQVGSSLVKGGIGELYITDPDVVGLSNLNRQHFTPGDLYRNKGHALARNLSKSGFLGTRVHGFPLFFSEFIQRFPGVVPTATVVGVDNDRARLQACDWSLRIGRPLVSVGIARDASGAYVFVQEPGMACLGCYLGGAHGGASCPRTPAVLDVLQVACGYASFALSSLLMPRHRGWNLIRTFLGTGGTTAVQIERRQDCPFCSESTSGNSTGE